MHPCDRRRTAKSGELPAAVHLVGRKPSRQGRDLSEAHVSLQRRRPGDSDVLVPDRCVCGEARSIYCESVSKDRICIQDYSLEGPLTAALAIVVSTLHDED